MTSDKDEIPCPMELAIQLINKKWVIQIIRDMFFGKTHFSEFKEDKPDLSNKVLSSCLKNLEKDGLIEKNISDIDGVVDISYSLTDYGRALNKVIYELAMYTLNEDINNTIYDDEQKKEIGEYFRDKLNIDDN
ncbi:helix-turn-helix domain-containing protein [uncultured Methanosphaera sp.]|uniref:winged helix-turn-helix transcriptional regulator n=1 Tax=uncultured Methanosphaera sp. TaxID=262501 RepID=UPI0025E01165|nr:helix-turn-helix domain-containing protein [uncultured Methanosphaera sp.]